MGIHYLHNFWLRCVLALLVVVCFSVSTHAAKQDEYSDFLGGFTAFQSQDYQGAAGKMSQFLKEYPTTPLRDMALFWLARAHFRLGEKQAAARYFALFLKEYPNAPLRNAAESELITLAQRYDEKNDSLVARATQRPVTETNDPPAFSVSPPAVRAVANQAPTIRVAAANPSMPDVPATPELSEPIPDQSSLSMKEAAILEYRRVLKKFPGTKAALSAAERLKELQSAKFTPVGEVQRIAESTHAMNPASTVTLEVGQFAAADLSLLRYRETCDAGMNISVPFKVVNRGNGSDTFNLDSGFPAEYKPRIVSASNPESSLAATPSLAPGESFSGMLVLKVPAAILDGQRSAYPIKLISSFDRDISISKEVPLVYSAPLLRMLVRPDKQIVLPGESINYKLALLNVGSATAKKISFSLSYPSQYEPSGPLPAGFRHEGNSLIAIDEMEVASGRRKEFNLAFRLKEDALAGQELFCRVELNDGTRKLTEAFHSPAAVVGRVNGVAIRVNNERRTVLPGEKIIIPVSVKNIGNFRDNLIIKTSIPSSIRYAIFRNYGSGVKQTDELVIDSINSLSPGEETSLRIELLAPANLSDKTDMSFNIVCQAASDMNKSAATSVQLVYSRPVVTLEMEVKNARLKPGEIAHLVLSAVNNGSGMAKDIEVISYLPVPIEVVAAEPVAFEGSKGEHFWRFTDLGSGEKRTLVLAYRIRPGVTAGTNLQIENIIRYKDQLGNSY